MKEFKILSPTAILGYGFPEESFKAGIALKPDLIACDAGSTLQYRYSGYFMAYRACYKTLEDICNTTGNMSPLQRLKQGESSKLKTDIAAYESYFGDEDCVSEGFCDMLVLWHIETVILPQMEEEEQTFDPTDENQVDLSGIVNAKP